MKVSVVLSIVFLALSFGPVAAEDAPASGAMTVDSVLARVAPELGAGFEPLPGEAGAFGAAISRGLRTCDRIDVEVRPRDGEEVVVLAFPRRGGERLDPARAVDREDLLRRLGVAAPGMAPLAWAATADAPVHAACVVRWGEDSSADGLQRALLAVPALDRHVGDLIPSFRPLGEEELASKLREASAADEPGRNRILEEIAPYLPELVPSPTPGESRFVKIAANRHGAAFDAFRFRVPAGEGERRLVWAFAYLPGTAKGWFIAPVSGDAPKFVKFHRGGRYEGSGVPADFATLLQRTETSLSPDHEYVIWIQFKVESPVELYVALGCFPFAKSDRDAPAALEEALGLKPVR